MAEFLHLVKKWDDTSKIIMSSLKSNFLQAFFCCYVLTYEMGYNGSDTRGIPPSPSSSKNRKNRKQNSQENAGLQLY